MGRRNGDHRNVEAFLLRNTLQLADVVDGNAASRFVPDLLVGGVEERRNLEPFLTEAGIVGERQPEVAGAHDRDPQVAVEAENLPQVAAQVLDVVADAADAEFTEVGEVLSDLRGVQVKLLRQGL